MTERVSQEAQLRADKLRLLEAVGFFGESRLGRRADGRQMLREIRQIAERLPALREQLEAEVRERLAREFEKRAEQSDFLHDYAIKCGDDPEQQNAVFFYKTQADTLRSAAHLARTFGTTEEGR